MQSIHLCCYKPIDVIKENKECDNLNWRQTPDYPYRILINGGSESGKTNSLWI